MVSTTRSVAPSQRTQSFLPRADAYETPEAVVLELDMPGVSAEGLNVEYHDGVLKIHGPVEARNLEGAKLIGAEYGIGEYQRAFSLAGEYDAENMHAEYKQGVLSVRLPKLPQAQPKKITVNVKNGA